MGCLKVYAEYRRRNIRMKNNNSKAIDYEKLAEEIVKKQKENRGSSNIWEVIKRVGSVLAVFGTVILATLFFTDKFATINEKIGGLETRVDTMNTEMGEISTQVGDISKYLYEDDGVKDQLGMIIEALNLKVINVTEDDTLSFLEDVYIENNDISNVSSAFNAEMTVGTDSNGNVYIAEDLIRETILLTYKEEGKEVFFLGQYNEDYHWDGYCVINTYNSNGTLYGICESNFDDGKRMDYKTIISVDSESNKWGYYSRICDGESNMGISKEYVFEYGIEKNFTNTNVRRTDMLFVDNFMEKQDAVLTKYYYGRTSDKLYNDETGEAYLVKFNEDGTVRTLYVGSFKNGYPNDKSGNAWNIAYVDEKGYYVHNTGNFTNGYADKHSSTEFTQEEIEELLVEYNFDCELKWK